jgi:hypothetical protein
MDRAYIEAAIGNLDAEIPKGDASVVISLYGGGPDECAMVANEAGYLRLGVEMLKAAFAPAGHYERAYAIPVELDYLFSPDSEVRINWFERRNPDVVPSVDSRWRLGDLAALAFGLFIVGMFVVGVIVTFTWVGALFRS